MLDNHKEVYIEYILLPTYHIFHHNFQLKLLEIYNMAIIKYKIINCNTYCSSFSLHLWNSTFTRFKDLTKTKIYDFKVRIVIFSFIQKVFRLQISMNNVLTMAIVDTMQHLLKAMCCFLFSEKFFFNNFIEQFPSCTELCD